MAVQIEIPDTIDMKDGKEIKKIDIISGSKESVEISTADPENVKSGVIINIAEAPNSEQLKS